MMESYLQNNFGDVKSKNSSEEALQRWRKLCEVVKNRKRRFRFTANLTKRSEAEAMRKTNQLRVAVLVSKAALQFIQGCTSSSEYTVPEEVEAAGFQICADELGSIVEGHDVKKLKVHGGVEGVANKLATSTTNGITTTDDELRSAGITVRMVTGDNINTAKAIARECGILTDGGLAIEDPEFREKSVDEMIEPITKIQVMARSSPLDKHTLVKHLRTMSNEVVAVTGDGTNDAPALHEADIGIAMGIAGTEVAKESADIIRDDNFSTMVAAAKWGRSVYQKFVQFQLALIVVELIVNFSSACLTGNVLLTAVQLLWVIMIKVALGALALETEPPLDDLMKREPVRRSGGFISNVMWRNILGQSLHQIVVIWYLQTRGKRSFQLAGPDADLILNTLIFNIFFFCQVFNEISSREMEKINVFKGMLKNYVFVGALTCAVAFQVIIIEFLGDFTNTTPLTSAQWFLSIFIGFLEIPIAAIIKLIALVSERDCMQAWKAFKHYLPLYLPLLISPSLSLSFHFSLPLPLPFTPSLKLGLSRSPSLLLSLGSSSLSFSFSTKQRATSSSSSASPSSSSPASLQCCPSSSQEPFVPLQHPHHLCNCKTESHAALPDDCTNSSRGMCISRVERIPSNEAETCPLE